MIRIALTNTDDLPLKLNTSLFSREGFIIYTATTGKELLQIAESYRLDMLFMDVDLPDMSGAACCLALKTGEKSCGVPVVMSVPSERELDIGLLLHVGCDAVIPRPIEGRDFVAAAKKFIKISERAQYRLPVRIPLRYDTELKGEQTGFLVNINTIGLFLETDDLLSPGTVIRVEFLLPDKERSISCTAVVSWLNEGSRIRPNLPLGMGLQFTDIGKEDTDVIAAFMSVKLKELGLKVGKFNVLQWCES